MSDSLKDLLSSAKNSDNNILVELIQKKKADVEKDYNNNEIINEDFLLMMLSKGYINENYSDYLSISYNKLLDKNEYTYINNIKINGSPDFFLKIEKPEYVIKQIKDFQWTKPSVLNNFILTHLLLENKDKESRKDYSLELLGFINAIQNNKNDNFIDQYITAISTEQERDKLIKVLFNGLPEKLTSSTLITFFSDNSGTLFCEWITDLSEERFNDCKDSLMLFLKSKERQHVLNDVLNLATQQDQLEKNLTKLNIEIEKLSNYKDRPKILQLLIKNAMFQLSKENLDFILEQKNELQSGYDYFSRYSNIWEKITDPNRIDFFTEKILLANDKLRYSEYGIEEILFNDNVNPKNVKKIIEKIKDNSIHLGALPICFKLDNKKNPESWSNIISDLLDQNKLYLDFDNILYVFQLYPKGFIEFAKKVYKNLELAIKSNYICNTILSEYAEKNILKDFCDQILINEKIDDELFENLSDIMIYQEIDIIRYMNSSIDFFDTGTFTSKKQILIKLIFKNSLINNDSINDVLKIINSGFGDFYQNFDKIKDKCISEWNCKKSWTSFLSIILENKNNILKEDQIDSIMKSISLDDFGDITTEWGTKYGKQNTSNNVNKLLTLKNLKTWVEKFGRSAVLDHLNNNEFLDIILINNLKETIEKNFNFSLDQEPIENETSHIKELLKIIDKYKIPLRAIFARRIKLKNLFDPLTTILQTDSNIELDWYKIIMAVHNIIYSKPYLRDALEIIQKNSDSSMARKKASLTLSNNFNRTTLKNDLFIIGRYFYNAIEYKHLSIDFFLSFEKNDLLKISSIFSLHPLLCGATFESFFDNDGNFKNTFNDFQFQLSRELNKNRNSEGYELIRDCLALFRYELDSQTASIFNL